MFTVVHHQQALKLQVSAADGNMDLNCATTLNNMGKLYMRRSRISNKDSEGQKDAKRAEVCFIRAVHLYRMSLVKNASEKVTEALYNLSQAREWQLERRGILRNVKFDASRKFRNAAHGNSEDFTNDSNSASSFDSDLETIESILSEVSNENKAGIGLFGAHFGLDRFFGCGGIEQTELFNAPVEQMMENDVAKTKFHRQPTGKNWVRTDGEESEAINCEEDEGSPQK